MALVGPNYERSAIDIISPMLTVTQRLRNEDDKNRELMLKGVEGLTKGITDAAAVQKRADMLDYKGDEYVKGLRARVEELKAELMKVQHELEQLEKADQMSNDVPDFKESEMTTVGGSDALGRYASNQMNGYEPSEIDISTDFSVAPERASKYKIGSKALGGF